MRSYISNTDLGAPVFRSASVHPFQIAQMEEFNARNDGLDPVLIRTLIQSLRNRGELDPVLLWDDRRDPENPRLVLLDGQHRLAAYHHVNKRRTGRSGEVPAQIVTCSLKEALLMSLSANTKDSIPLSNRERTNAAWRLVRHPDIKFSKSELARASGVSPRNIAYMRKRLKELREADREPSGDWLIDRQDKRDNGEYDFSDDEIKAKIKELTEKLQGPLGGWKREPLEVIAGALDNVFGHQLHYIVDYLYEEDEFDLDAISTETGAYVVVPEDFVAPEDNEDF